MAHADAAALLPGALEPKFKFHTRIDPSSAPDATRGTERPGGACTEGAIEPEAAVRGKPRQVTAVVWPFKQVASCHFPSEGCALLLLLLWPLTVFSWLLLLLSS